MGVVCFFSPIFSYFCLFVAALRPCQGKLPRRKYIKTWPRDSRSSRLDCSVCGLWIRRRIATRQAMIAPLPKCVFMLMYRAVPLRLFRSRYGMCCFVFGSRYCLAIPKSTTCTTGTRSATDDSTTQTKEMRTIGGLGPWSTNEEVVGFDVTVDQILLVDGLHARDLPFLFRIAAQNRASDTPFAVRPCTPS